MISYRPEIKERTRSCLAICSAELQKLKSATQGTMPGDPQLATSN